MIPEIRIKSCRHGRFMYFINDSYIGASMDIYGEYSEGEVALWDQFIKPGMTIIEAGAHIGTLTIPLAKMAGPSGRVMAFEPQKQLSQMLSGNLALNEITNTTVMTAVAGATSDNTRIPKVDYSIIGNFGGISMKVDADHASVESPMMSIDMMGLTPVHFMKIDVEGMESEVIQGSTETIKKNKPVLYVENDRVNKSKDLIQTIMDLHYRLFWHIIPLYNPNNFNDNNYNMFGEVCSFNMLCISKEIKLNMVGMTEIMDPNYHPLNPSNVVKITKEEDHIYGPS